MTSESVGLVEVLTPFRVKGWAMDQANPALALDLVLRIDGIAIDGFRPNHPLPAIADYLGWPQDRLGLIGFDLALPDWVADGQPHTVEVLLAATGVPLRSSQSQVCHTSTQRPLVDLPRRPVMARAAVGLAPVAAQPQVSVIVLNRNGCELLRQLFESWQQHDQSVPVEWVVVDHASSDASLALLQDWEQRWPMQVLALDHNDSFSASCNRAAELAKGEYLLFLNNDIVWLHDALPAMLQTLADPGVGAVGLKLLKPIGRSGAIAAVAPLHTSVQHLGVRYALQHDGYYPFEVAPSSNQSEHTFDAQEVPAVTAAVLLCRQQDFERAGGFDTDFFYGFEDVEFCLRLRHRLQLKVICRNDLSALHRHGHTRLSGREQGQFDRILDNARVLSRKTGLWAKATWRNSLLRADRLMTTERLRIGLVIDCPLSHDQAPPRANASARWATRLGYAIEQALPQAQVLLLHPGLDAHDARGLHYLVTDSPDYDIRLQRYARADLVLLAYLSGPTLSWLTCPWRDSFHGYLVPNASRRKTLPGVMAGSFETSSAHKPLGNQVVPDQWPLRVGLDWPAAAAAPPAAASSAARQLQTTLKNQGLACWLLPTDPGPAGLRVLDVRICIVAQSPAQAALPEPQQGTLNLVWWLAATASPACPPDWLPLRAAPQAKQLKRLWKAQIDRTFSAP